VRLSEDKIKAAILHPEMEIRDRATSYFARSCSCDTTIMPLVIKAVETYGRQNDAYRLIGLSRDLPQTQNTIAWVLGELNDESCNRHENYANNLSMVLVNANLALLLPWESEILESRHLLPYFRKVLVERLRMSSGDEATCWQELEEFCEQGKNKQYTREVNLDYAGSIVEALSRHGRECETKVREYLAVEVDDYSQHPMKWLEPLLVRLAGLARLESTIPLIVAKLHEDDDLLVDACGKALIRIGTPAVLHAVAEAWPAAERHFRVYASGPLEHIHSDLAVETCIRLFEQETDRYIRRELAFALLNQFAREGIQRARQLLLGPELEIDDKDLRNFLLETCTFTGERFPEYDQWLATERAEESKHRRKVKELEGDPMGLLKFALERMTGEKEAKPPILPVSGMALPRKPALKHKVGRNDPCPCGSGRKFKHCCLNK
jgi:hypothetical protein